jgi:ABC-type lipoprotein release transport system permease subunit
LKLAKMAYIISGNLGERKTRTATAVFVIAFAVAVVMVISALGIGFLRGALAKAQEAFPPGLLMVKPRAMNVSILSLSTAVINDATVARIRKMPEVEFVAPQVSLKMPLRAEGEILGQQAVTDAIMVGIDPVVVKGEVGPKFSFDYDEKTSQPIPCVLARYFLDMYNLAYADTMGLPKINENFALGKTFTLHLGESYLLGGPGGAKAKTMDVTCKVVALTSNPSLYVGALIPLRHAEELNKWYTGESTKSYNAMHVKVRDVGRLDQVTSRIVEMGLNVESSKDVLEKLQFVVRAVGLLTALFAIVVLAIAATSIFNTFSLIMNERRGEVGLLRAVGGTRRLVTWLFVTEVAVIGLLGGIVGVAASWVLVRWGNAAIVSRLPKVTFLPEHLFLVNWWLVASCLAGAVLLSVVATLPAILRTTGTPPATLISES